MQPRLFSNIPIMSFIYCRKLQLMILYISTSTVARGTLLALNIIVQKVQER